MADIKNTDYYFEGMIYSDKQFDNREFGLALSISKDKARQHLERMEYTSYQVIGPHPFTDGQDVTGLYEVGYQWKMFGNDEWKDCSKDFFDDESNRGQFRRTVAVSVNRGRKVLPTQAYPTGTVYATPSLDQQARDLVEKFMSIVLGETKSREPFTMPIDEAKQCAIIGTQNTISELEYLKKIIADEKYQDAIDIRISHYQSLREAIENL